MKRKFNHCLTPEFLARRDDITVDNIMIDKQQCIEESSENIAIERTFSLLSRIFKSSLGEASSSSWERGKFIFVYELKACAYNHQT